MSNRIKKQREFFQKVIREAQEELKLLQAACRHEATFEGNYEWRTGATIRAKICDDCGAMVENRGCPIPDL